MTTLNRWGLAAGLAAALALIGSAQAQSSTSGGTGSSSGAGSSGSRGDTGGPAPGGGDRSSAQGSTDPQGGVPGSSSASGSQSGQSGTGSSAGSSGSSASGGTGAGSEPSGRQAATGKSGAAGKVDKDLQEKLEKLHAAHQAEVQMAQVAKQNAESPNVKQFAEQMETDHQRADQKLTQTAQSMGLNLEGKAFQKEQEKAKEDMEKLQSKTGQEFDKEYMSHMVKDHEKDVKAVDSARKDAKKGNHAELATLLDSAHTGMKGHLEHAKQIEKSLEKGGGAQRQGRTPTGSSGMGTGSGQQPGSGSRGDTGGPAPGGADKGSQKSATDPQGGVPGSSSDSGQRTTK
jgi:putative membrane protein